MLSWQSTELNYKKTKREIKISTLQENKKQKNKNKKNMEGEGDNDTDCNWCTRNNPKELLKGLEDLEIGGRVKTIHSIFKIGHNTEKSPGHLRKLAVPQIPLRNHRLTLVWKTDTHKLQWDFDIHTDHLISARRPGLIIINKKMN